MNKEYWIRYYQNLQPTSFAKFCLTYMPRNGKIIDLGCGNGRDSYFFGGQSNIKCVCGVDFAYEPDEKRHTHFSNISLEELLFAKCLDWTVYSRFFLHSITKPQIRRLIKWSTNMFMAEFRDASDVPTLYTTHKRTKVDGKWVKQLLINNGFEILYYKKGRNMAKYKTENPICVRVIARKR